LLVNEAVPHARHAKPVARNPWAWIPTLYLAQGLPYAVVNVMSVIMYKSLGVANTDIALYTSWLNLPWVLKPFWSPVVDILKTRRSWIWITQFLLGAGFAAIGLTLPLPAFFKVTLIVFWLVAFSSATHDIAADGFYMLGLTEKQQAFFVGVRSTCFRISMIAGQGFLVVLAGIVQSETGLPELRISVAARPDVALLETGDLFRAFRDVSAQPGLRILAEAETLTIRAEPRQPAEVATLLASARAWNVTNRFNRVQAQFQIQDQKTEASWWTRHIAVPFGEWLRRTFGPEVQGQTDIAGNIGWVRLRLSQAPGREVVVTPALKSGDKSVSIAEGTRLVFDDSNWNQAALVVFQLDPKLKKQTAATFEMRSGNIPLSWMVTFAVLLGTFVLFAAYHRFILPYPESDQPGDTRNIATFLKEFFRTFRGFFRKDRVGVLLLFLLFYRFGEAQLMKMVAPFLLDAREVGGLGLTTGQVGLVYGTIGIMALTAGGLLGGVLVSRNGLKFWLWPMVFVMHLPDAMFIYLAYAQPDNLALISLGVAIEQFGYGFGFTAYMLYMINIARGSHQTAHYAICTGFMALGVMLPGMWSGWLVDQIGYQHFFVWVVLATIPGFIVTALVPLEKEFGRKRET
jgi:MFS transporter, PAT family, beta-lactamase induction signal transducer AmpG